MAGTAAVEMQVRMRRAWLVVAAMRLYGLTGWEWPVRAAVRAVAVDMRIDGGRWHYCGGFEVAG